MTSSGSHTGAWLAGLTCCAALLSPVARAADPSAADAPGASASAFKDLAAQESYAIGAQTARTLRKDGVPLDVEMLLQGFRDGSGDGKLLLDEKELKAVMLRVQQDVHRNMVLNRRALADRNRTDGLALLATHGRQPGVHTTASGLQYEVLDAGAGDHPFLNSTVMVNFRGTLPDGVPFDASPTGKPAQMFVAQALPGLKEALQLMPVGARWRLMLPANLAYGDRGAGDAIGPNQVLQFDLELVEIRQATAAQ